MQNRLQSISFMLKFDVTVKEAREKLIAMKNILESLKCMHIIVLGEFRRLL